MTEKKTKAKDAAEEKPAKASKAAVKKEAAPKKDVKKEAKKAEKPAKKSSSSVLADASLYDVIVRPVVTEKSTMALEHNKVQFKVAGNASKPRIKQAVESLFGVDVVSVNTLTVKGKTKRFRGIAGRRSDVKKAIVTLKEGQTIDFAAGVK